MYSQNDENHVEKEAGLPNGYEIDNRRYQQANNMKSKA